MTNAQNSGCLKPSQLAAVLLVALATAFPTCGIAVESTKTAALASQNNDLGAEARNGSVALRPAGVGAEDAFYGIKLVVTPEYSNQTGLSLGVGLAGMLGDNAAIGVLLNSGIDKREILLNAGFTVDQRQRLILSAGLLEQSLDFAFPSGTEQARVAQNSVGLGYQFELDRGFLRNLEFNGYFSRTANRDLSDKTFAVETSTLYELWNDRRRIAGGRIGGLQGRLGFTPFAGSLVKVGLGYEHLNYDLLARSEHTNRPTAGLEWQQQLGHDYQFLLGVESFAAQDRYSIGLERSLADASGRHSIGLNLISVHGRDTMGNDQQAHVAYRFAFGSGAASPATALARGPFPGQDMSGSHLLDSVAMRPSYMPSRVVAKVDPAAVPIRQFAVNKTRLPAGSVIDSATGDVTVPLGATVTNIAGINRHSSVNGLVNRTVFTNSGQFLLDSNTLTVRPSQIVQPASGAAEIYVVTVNNAGGGVINAAVGVFEGEFQFNLIAPSGSIRR